MGTIKDDNAYTAQPYMNRAENTTHGATRACADRETHAEA
jgi:hypothetical protein